MEIILPMELIVTKAITLTTELIIKDDKLKGVQERNTVFFLPAL